MLQAAKERRAESIDIIIGLVETHGRKETAALMNGLEVLPPKLIEYRGTTMREFDLDAALKRKPSIILVDELAHTNAQGCRHPKRWQDIEELLDAGIDVYTALNVQHLESLNDDIGQISGVRVWETVPDTVFDQANEIELVDLPPDELLNRLRDGKVYFSAKVISLRYGNWHCGKPLIGSMPKCWIIGKIMRFAKSGRSMSALWSVLAPMPYRNG